MGLRGENIPDRKSKAPYGQNPIRKREKRKAAGKKAIKQSDRAANKLRIAKEWLKNPRSLNKSERNILDNLITSLGKKYGKKEGYQSLKTLRNWVDNKGGIRNKALLGIGDEALEFPKSLKRKRTALQKVEDKRDAEAAQRAVSASAQMQDEPPKESSPTPTVPKSRSPGYGPRQGQGALGGRAKVVPRTADTGIAFGPRTVAKKRDKSAASASPTGTADTGIAFGPSSAASAVSSKTKTSKGKKVTIRQDDTLSDLAKAKGITLGAIRKANPGRFPTAKSLNLIKVGEKINMPPGTGAKTPYDVPIVSVEPKKRQAKVTGKAKKDERDLAHRDPKGKYYPTRGTRPELQHHEPRYIKLPEWLGGGRIKTEVGDEDDEFVGMNKKGGQIKKSVKKVKTKPRKAKAKTRKRAALRGHRAELRGG